MLQNLEQVLGSPPYTEIQSSYKHPEQGLEFSGKIRSGEKIRLWFFRTVEDKYPDLGVRVRDGTYNEYNPKEQFSQEGHSIWIDSKLNSYEICSKINRVLDNPVYRTLEAKVYMAWIGPDIIFGDFDEKMEGVSKEMKARLRATIAAYGVVELKDYSEITEVAQPHMTPESRAKETQKMRDRGKAYESELKERGVAPLSKEELEDFFVKLLEPEFSLPKT